MTGNASTRSVGMSAANEPKSPTPMGGASVSEVLAAAADLLEKLGAWTQFDFAHDAVGRAVDYTSSDAVCWCARGAIGVIGRENDDADYRAVHRLWTAAAKQMGFDQIEDIETWNDAPGRTQTEVVNTLRQAARQASNPTAEGV